MKKKTFSRAKNRVAKYENRIKQREDRYAEVYVLMDDARKGTKRKRRLNEELDLIARQIRNDRARVNDAKRRAYVVA